MKNIKKIISICTVIVLILSMTASVFAQQKEDIFYFDKNDSRLQSAIKRNQSNMHSLAFNFLRQDSIKSLYMSENEKLDASKLSYDMERIYAFYDWDCEDVLGFMKASNKSEFIETLELKSVIFPVYYNGKLFERYYEYFIYNKDSDTFEYNFGWSFYKALYADKDYLEKVLKDDGFEGYEILQSATISNLQFVLAQKDGQTFAIYIPTEYFFDFYDPEDVKDNAYYKAHKELFEKRIFTESQIEQLSQTQKKLRAENENKPYFIPEDALEGSGSATTTGIDNQTGSADTSNGKNSDAITTGAANQTEAADTSKEQTADTVGTVAKDSEAEDTQNADMPLAEDTPEKASPVIWIVLGAIVLAFAGIVIFALIKKKKA